jgi:hypothetical protein
MIELAHFFNAIRTCIDHSFFSRLIHKNAVNVEDNYSLTKQNLIARIMDLLIERANILNTSNRVSLSISTSIVNTSPYIKTTGQIRKILMRNTNYKLLKRILIQISLLLNSTSSSSYTRINCKRKLKITD